MFVKLKARSCLQFYYAGRMSLIFCGSAATHVLACTLRCGTLKSTTFAST